MNIIITHKTAFLYYRHFRSNRTNSLNHDLKFAENIKIPEFYDKHNCLQAKSFCDNLIPEPKPQLLISNHNHRNLSINATAICTSIKYPKNSFRKIDDGIYIPTPELLFFQLSQKLNFPKLMLAGLELCSCYALATDGNLDFVKDTLPLTNKSKIQSYLKELKALNNNLRHYNIATYAASLLEDNSYSPQESRLFIMLCGPRKFGAYGIKNMQFNREIKLSNKAGKIASQNYIYPDLCNPNSKVAIEYDSNTYHNNDEQNNKDKLRINAMQSDGWRVFIFIKNNTHNRDSMHYMALDILKANGQDKRIRTQNFIYKRNNLFNELYLTN